jgi:hypothetical protein
MLLIKWRKVKDTNLWQTVCRRGSRTYYGQPVPMAFAVRMGWKPELVEE